MTSLRELSVRMLALLRTRRLDEEMAEEMRFHLELRTQANVEAGMPSEDARYAAMRRFGGIEQVKETCRDHRGFVWLENVVRDFLHGARMLRKSPVFTAVAVLSLSLGIGANTTIFSLLNDVLLRSLPVRSPGELRVLNWVGHNVELSRYAGSGRRTTATGGRVSGSFPYATYRDFRDRSAGLADLFAFSPLPRCTALTPEASVVEGLMVSGNFFRGYGAHTQVGRTLSTEDDRPGAVPVVVITHRWWERQFGLDPTVLGRQISINGIGLTVVGILPREYRGPVPGDPSDFYVPLSHQPELLPRFPLASYHHWWVEIMARVAAGSDERSLRAMLETVFTQALAAPGGKTKMTEPHLLLEDGSRGPLLPRERILQPIYVLLAAVGAVLLIVCANLASLMLARGAVRRHEYALRAAIGAPRSRLVLQSVIESLMLALAGAVLGLLFAAWGKRVLLGMLSGPLGSYHLDMSFDTTVIIFTLAVSLGTVLLFGLLPALRTTNARIAGLKDPATGHAPRLALGKGLVTVQVGLSVVLLIGAALFVQTFARLIRVDTGFDTGNLLLFRVSPDQAGYKGQQLEQFYEKVDESVSATPGVRDVGFSSLPLLGGGYSSVGVKIPGRDVRSADVGRLIVSDGFLSLMGIPLLMGRELTRADDATGPKAVVANESFIREYFPHEDPLGKSVMLASDEYRIVGLCRDAKFRDLRSNAPILYYSFRQDVPESVVFQVRCHAAPESLVPAVRKAVASVDPTIPVTDVRTQSQQIAQLLVMEQLFADLCTFLAALALLLSCIGLYGLVSYGVSRRRTEIGIRMALGAKPSQESWRVIREALVLSGTGAVLGMATALAAGRFIEARLYGVTPSDPVTYVGAVSLLIVIVVLASWVPARRAASVDPLLALRAE